MLFTGITTYIHVSQRERKKYIQMKGNFFYYGAIMQFKSIIYKTVNLSLTL